MSSPPPAGSILLYAELLSNIRQVSVSCFLPAPATPATQAAVSADGRVLTVRLDDGAEQSLRLPGRVAAPSSSRLPLPLPLAQSGAPTSGPGTRSLSWRLPLAVAAAAAEEREDEDEGVVGDDGPWSAGALAPGSAVGCRVCQATVVRAGALREWMDLPSENWAEMMEFWHCHKPHNDDHDHGHDRDRDDKERHLQTTRGYGAGSRIAARAGVGLVDLTSFLISEADVSESAVTSAAVQGGPGREDGEDRRALDGTESSMHSLACCGCGSRLGVRHANSPSCSLFKWRVTVDQRAPTRATPPPLPTLSHCVSAMLSATMARSGCSKSILLPLKLDGVRALGGSPGRPLLNIWLFNGKITFSSTAEPRSPLRAAKVFYRMVSQTEADRMLESMTSDVQDISLPGEAINAVLALLQTSNSFIPPTDRKFKDWAVGLLER
ncbi:ubiquitin-conjugating enzyme E2C-binding protein [Xylariaceae sp. FL0804]|nr:ubiquitin-conjugating enzyme E2C-binding protein [Xylariaceae sp. FL0804]